MTGVEISTKSTQEIFERRVYPFRCFQIPNWGRQREKKSSNKLDLRLETGGSAAVLERIIQFGVAKRKTVRNM